MQESLERQDSGTLFVLLGETDRAERQVAENRRRFEDALARAAANVTEPGEQQIVDDVQRTKEATTRPSTDVPPISTSWSRCSIIYAATWIVCWSSIRPRCCASPPMPSA